MTRKTRKKGCFSESTAILEKHDKGSKSAHFQEKGLFFLVSHSVIFVTQGKWDKIERKAVFFKIKVKFPLRVYKENGLKRAKRGLSEKANSRLECILKICGHACVQSGNLSAPPPPGKT